MPFTVLFVLVRFSWAKITPEADFPLLLRRKPKTNLWSLLLLAALGIIGAFGIFGIKTKHTMRTHSRLRRVGLGLRATPSPFYQLKKSRRFRTQADCFGDKFSFSFSRQKIHFSGHLKLKTAAHVCT